MSSFIQPFNKHLWAPTLCGVYSYLPLHTFCSGCCWNITSAQGWMVDGIELWRMATQPIPGSGGLPSGATHLVSLGVPHSSQVRVLNVVPPCGRDVPSSPHLRKIHHFLATQPHSVSRVARSHQENHLNPHLLFLPS